MGSNPIWVLQLTGCVVAHAVEHLGAGSRHHLAGAAPRPAGADAVDGGVAIGAGACEREDTSVRNTHTHTQISADIPGTAASDRI